MENEEMYRKEKVTTNVFLANFFVILLIIPTVLIFGLPYYLIWKNEFQFKDFLPSHGGLWIVIVVLILGVIAHELIHGIIWSRFTKNGFKSIKFGIVWKMMTPYCHCKEPLKVRQYAIGSIMPAIILGFIPAILAIITGNAGLLIFGIFFIIVACGDFFILFTLRKEKGDTLIEDHPSEIGFYAYRTIEKS